MIILDFEKSLAEKRQALMILQSDPNSSATTKKKLQIEINQKIEEVYGNLTPWQITQVARHPNRPGTLDFIDSQVEDFVELCGDRMFANDNAIIGGLGKLNSIPFMIIGQIKGKNTTENVKYNFGMSHPEGYRKALRLMKMAERFKLPILTLVDTPGAYPGIEAERRQQSAAIAECLRVMGKLVVPIIAVVMGEAGSGGALAISVANRLLMLSNSVFGVISAEGCASILWNDPTKNKQAAEILKYTAKDLFKLGIADLIINEPELCAHNQPDKALPAISKAIISQYLLLKDMTPAELRLDRYEKFRRIGVYNDNVEKVALKAKPVKKVIKNVKAPEKKQLPSQKKQK